VGGGSWAGGGGGDRLTCSTSETGQEDEKRTSKKAKARLRENECLTDATREVSLKSQEGCHHRVRYS